MEASTQLNLLQWREDTPARQPAIPIAVRKEKGVAQVLACKAKGVVPTSGWYSKCGAMKSGHDERKEFGWGWAAAL